MYDRVTLVKRMERALDREAEFVSFQAGNLDLILLVCGCETACVDISGFKNVSFRIISSILDGDIFVERFGGGVSTGSVIIDIHARKFHYCPVSTAIKRFHEANSRR